MVPKRRKKTGTKPGVTGKGPRGRKVGLQEQWEFPDIILQEEDKKNILAGVIRIAIEVLFAIHLYTF